MSRRRTLQRVLFAVAAFLVCSCVVVGGYSHRGAPGGVVTGGIDLYGERYVVGYQQGLSVHAEMEGSALSFHGDLHGGWTSRSVHEMGAGDVMLSVLAYAGVARTIGDVYGDSTFPIGLGLTGMLRISECRAVTLTPRYNYHFGDELAASRSHELLITIGYRWDQKSEDPDAIFGRRCI